MKTGILLAFTFLLLLLIERSFFHAFAGSLASIPVLLIAGMILMQRAGIEEGIAWFLAVAVLQANGVALLLALVSPILIVQIFTTRSVYALLGFGVVTYAISSTLFILFGAFFDIAFGTTILSNHPVLHAIQEGILLIPGLILGVMIVRSIEHRILRRFAFKSFS